MGWVKLDSGFFLHPKALAAGRDGRDLFLAALCWSAQQETDGAVAAHALPMIAACAGVADADQAASRLVECGLWANSVGGWSIHGYEEWQTTRSERDAWRARERARKSKTPPTDPGSLPRGIRAESAAVPRDRREEKRREETSPSESYPQPSPQTGENRAHAALLVLGDLIAKQNRASNPTRYAASIVRNAEQLPALQDLADRLPNAEPAQLAALLLNGPARPVCDLCGAVNHPASLCPIGAAQ